MVEYIEREVLLSRLTFEYGYCIPEVDVDNFPTTVTIRDIKKLIRDIPAANVASIVYGQIITKTDRWHTGYQECSVCGAGLEWRAYPNYCPSCGAKMNGGEDIDKE